MTSRDTIPRLKPAPSLTGRAYKIVKEAIVSLTLLPGEAISENSLAQQLGTSRSPVRQTLKLLEHEGLTTSQPQKGTYVSLLNEREARDAVIMRRVLESWAVDEAARLQAKPDLAALDALLQEQERAINEGAYMGFFDLDSAFHGVIVRAADNHMAVELLDQLNLTILRVRAWTLRRNKSLDAGLSEHRAIYARLAAGDWAGAKQLLLDANDELFAAVQKMRATEPNWFAVVEPVATLQH